MVAVAERALSAGDTLDGEGGYTVWGKLMPAERSLADGALPIGLAHGVRLTRDLAAGQVLRWSDIVATEGPAVEARRQMERQFAPSRHETSSAAK